MKRFIAQFGRHHIKGLLADREFIGDEWMGWLFEQEIPFYIRIRNNARIINAQGQRIRVERLFYGLKPGSTRHLSTARYLGNRCLKGRGFKLEETRVVGYLRIKKLLVLPVIAFCWSHKAGEWKHDCELPIKTKTHQRLAQSLFRYGLDCIRSTLFNVLSQSKRMIRKVIALLQPIPFVTGIHETHLS